MRDADGGGRGKTAGSRQPVQKKGEMLVGSERKVTFQSPASKPFNRLFSSDSKAKHPSTSFFTLTQDSSNRSFSPSFRPPSPHSSPLLQVTRVDLTDSEVTQVSETMADKAKLRFTQAALSLTAKKISELRNCNPPLPELESVCLAVLAVLIRVNPASSLFGQSYTWKSFLGYLQQPAEALNSLRSAAVSVEAGVIDRGRAYIGLIQNLKERLKRVNEQNLLKHEISGTGLLLHDYLTSLISYAEIFHEEKGHIIPPAPFPGPEEQMPSRTRLLTSLYSRVFHTTDKRPPSQYFPHSRRHQSEEIAKIFETPSLIREEDLEESKARFSFAEKVESSFTTPLAGNQSQVDMRELEESLGEQVLGDLSFSKPLEQESFCGLEQMEQLDFDHFATYSVPKLSESPSNLSLTPSLKWPKKRVLVENQSNSRSHHMLKSTPKLSTSKTPKSLPKIQSKEEQMTKKKFNWQLEDAFRKFLKSKLATENAEKLVRSRVDIISEFQVEIEATTSRTIPEEQESLYADTVLELYERLAGERNFRSELLYAGLTLQPSSKQTTGKARNWMQQEVGKEKAKLAKGMGKFTRVK